MTAKHISTSPVSMTTPMTSLNMGSAGFHGNLDLTLSTQALLLKHSFLQKLVSDLQVCSLVILILSFFCPFRFFERFFRVSFVRWCAVNNFIYPRKVRIAVLHLCTRNKWHGITMRFWRNTLVYCSVNIWRLLFLTVLISFKMVFVSTSSYFKSGIKSLNRQISARLAAKTP